VSKLFREFSTAYICQICQRVCHNRASCVFGSRRLKFRFLCTFIIRDIKSSINSVRRIRLSGLMQERDLADCGVCETNERDRPAGVRRG